MIWLKMLMNDDIRTLVIGLSSHKILITFYKKNINLIPAYLVESYNIGAHIPLKKKELYGHMFISHNPI
jgi:hypothetical protein